MPWARLVHQLDQAQLPKSSKSQYQVPDAIAFLETPDGSELPLLIDVKRVKLGSSSLKVFSQQVHLTESYASAVGLPLLYATYWDSWGCWTLTTPDAFSGDGAKKKLSVDDAISLDCSALFGDASFIFLDTAERQTVFSSQQSDALFSDPKLGQAVSDRLVIGDVDRELTAFESAAVDVLFEGKPVIHKEAEEVQLARYQLETPSLVRFSNWVVRHLMAFDASPEHQICSTSAQCVRSLAGSMATELSYLYPYGGSEQLDALGTRYFGDKYLLMRDELVKQARD